MRLLSMSATISALAIAGCIVAPTLANAAQSTPSPAPADAKTVTVLATGLTYADATVSYHACNIVNISAVSVYMKIDLIANAGTILATADYTTNPLIAKGFSEIRSSTNYSGFAWCRFKITDTPNAVRANISVFKNDNTYYETLSLDDAR
jgi:hypothetical protein